MINKFRKNYIIVLLIVTGCFLITSSTQAAKLFFETDVTEIGIGQEIKVTLRLDTEGEIINAIEGEIRLPEIISMESIKDGNSIISFWVEQPRIENTKTIIFSGIVPGGSEINNGEIFSFTAKTNSEGVGSIGFSSAHVLLHDGQGTEVDIQIDTLSLLVDTEISLTDFSTETDMEPPEKFELNLTDDENVFSGDYFLVFASQDKSSGIGYYEVLETKKRLIDERLGEWQIVKSPYQIKDQTLTSFVYIRAVDRVGNVRVSVIKPSPEIIKPAYYTYYKYIILAFLAILIPIVVKMIIRKE